MARNHDEARAADEVRTLGKYNMLVCFTDPEDKDALSPRAGYRPTGDRLTYLKSSKIRFK